MANGKSAHVTEYAIAGIGFSPAVVWVDDKNRFFAMPSTLRRK